MRGVLWDFGDENRRINPHRICGLDGATIVRLRQNDLLFPFFTLDCRSEEAIRNGNLAITRAVGCASI